MAGWVAAFSLTAPRCQSEGSELKDKVRGEGQPGIAGIALGIGLVTTSVRYSFPAKPRFTGCDGPGSGGIRIREGRRSAVGDQRSAGGGGC